jgi:DNA-binding CsgD family transcriptional regulator
MKERPSRSQSYQYLIAETSVSLEFLESFQGTQSIGFMLNPWEYNEEVEELRDQLKVEFWKLAEKVLTPRQYQIICMLRAGMTQQEIANHYGIQQSCITKSLNGNTVYVNANGRDEKYIGKRYGGIIQKLTRIIDKDPIFLELFQKITDLQTEKL